MSRTLVHARARVVSLAGTLVAGVLLAGSMASASDPPPTTLGEVDLDAATVPELQALMDAGELSSVELVDFFLERIDAIEPQVNAIIALSPTAREDAQAADDARAAGESGALLGIPVLIKDNIGTTGMPTTAGSYALETSAPPDAFVVERLRDAGAVILGKTNLSEWANFRSFPSSSGWSALGGQTANPYSLDRNPCGSSSGSAAAVAATMASVAVGTETDGSVICPAGAVGIVGIKPSIGLVSRSGIVPISSYQDTAGPMTRNVTDAAVLLGAMAGADPADAVTADAAGQDTDYTAALDPNALEGARIGVWREGNFGLNPPVDAIMEDVIARFAAAGATIVDPADLAGLDPMFENEYPALLCEFKAEIETYLGTLGPDTPKTLQDLVDFNLEHADLEMEHFKQEVFDEALAAPAIDDPACVDARTAATAAAQQAIDGLMAEHELDAILAPTGEPAWLTDTVGGDVYVGPYSAPPAAVAGYPAITFMVGDISGLPIGVSLFGSKWSEAELIGLAYAYEQANPVRVPPTLPAAVEFEGFVPSPAPETSAEPAESEPPA
jgi:amidase